MKSKKLTIGKKVIFTNEDQEQKTGIITNIIIINSTTKMCFFNLGTKYGLSTLKFNHTQEDVLYSMQITLDEYPNLEYTSTDLLYNRLYIVYSSTGFDIFTEDSIKLPGLINKVEEDANPSLEFFDQLYEVIQPANIVINFNMAKFKQLKEKEKMQTAKFLESMERKYSKP